MTLILEDRHRTYGFLSVLHPETFHTLGTAIRVNPTTDTWLIECCIEQNVNPQRMVRGLETVIAKLRRFGELNDLYTRKKISREAVLVAFCTVE